MELLAGARDDRRERDLVRLLDRFELLRFRPGGALRRAVRIYRSCRRVGVTPRGLIDCMIMAVAVGSGVPLLAHDRDFAQVAQVIDLRLDAGSLGGPAR